MGPDTNPHHPTIAIDCLDMISQCSMAHIRRLVKRSTKDSLPTNPSRLHAKSNDVIV